jgi:hypothetical protein
MFQNEELKSHLLSSSTIKSNAFVVAEWNLNDIDNVEKIGNYRYRPLDGVASKYGSLPSSYDPLDEGNFYTNATNSDVVLDGGIDDSGMPTLLKQPKEKERLLYSLEDCLGRFRPRSGINKVRYGITPYVHHSHPDMALRPRYYMSHKADKFKYWTSYRVENGIEYGIANIKSNGENVINDAAPFVVYKSNVAANRIVLKMQTNVGSINLSPFNTLNGQIQDPLFGYENQTTPAEWQVDVLVNDRWETVKKFTAESSRPDGSPIVGPDGYVELSYGLIVPEEFADIFVYSGVVSSEAALPIQSQDGDGYLIKTSDIDKGVLAVWRNTTWEYFAPQYGWLLVDSTVTQKSNFVTDLASPDSYNDGIAGLQYREFQYISGIRVAATKMNKYNSTLDIIEISPRLVADISDLTESFNITKAASDLGTTGLPVGQLLASTGTLSLFDPEQAFLESNPSSIVPLESFNNMQVKFFDVITNDGGRFYVPLKTMYVESFPEFNPNTRDVSISLRDLYFYFESISTPEFLMTNVSISYAISSLLDHIGFSNYTFKRLASETEEVIPFFYTDPEKSIAETLQDIAVSTQSAMFFDEYNNFVVMSKNYMIPSESQRSTDIALLGTKDFDRNGVYKNQTTSNRLANIVDISMQPDSVYNDGKINYSVKYIQKSVANTKQALLSEAKRSWVYQPTTLWKASGVEKRTAINEQKATSNVYVLTATPLKSNLSNQIPTVVNGQVVNNIIDFGEAIALLDKYNGYFYANGEVIKFDAIEYSITGITAPVWITSLDEYQNYFSKLLFNGKIYPTGRVRIFSEPNYRIVNGQTVLANGPVAKHGRGQFGTQVTEHPAGLNTKWTNGSSVSGLGMNSKFIFDISIDDELVAVKALSEQDAARRQEIIQKKSAIKVLQEEISSLNKNLLLTPGNSAIISEISSINSSIADAEEDIANAMNSLSVSLQDSVKFMPSSEAVSQAKKTIINGKIKNFMAASSFTENANATRLTLESQMTQASALIMDGAGSANPVYSPINHITYVYTSSPSVSGEVSTTSSFYTHFGTRMRIVGKMSSSSAAFQEASGSMPYLSLETDNPETNPVLAGGSGGIAGLLNPTTGDGYYFEIAALDTENIEQFGAANVFFYKVITSNPTANSGYKQYSMPELLWRGVADIAVDHGDFLGQSRVFAQEGIQGVKDIAFEYVDNVDGTRTFFLYMDGTQIASVTDNNPITAGNGMALFLRGTSKCMFENIYALAHNYASNPLLKLSPVVNSAFGTNVVNINESFSKYAISGLVQSTYLANIGSGEPPKYNIYYDEFGTIMREAAYFDVKYTEAYPALYSRMTPNPSKLKTYVVSSFFGGSYSAEFLVFNATDAMLEISPETQSSLEIQGITFTQDSQNQLSVDEFFNEKAKMSNPEISNGIVVTSPSLFKQQYQEIKNNRIMYGRNEFNIDARYIQNRDSANNLMLWLSNKIMKPRKSVGVSIFPNPMIQLGDIVEVDYSVDGVSQIGYGSNRFVVYQIEYFRSPDGPEMQVFLSEVS